MRVKWEDEMTEKVRWKRLQPFRDAWFNHRPVGQHDDGKHLVDRSFDRVRKGNQPERNWRRPKFLSLQCPGLEAVKCRHEVCGDFGHFLFGRSLRDILLIGLENVFKRPAVHGRAPVSKQLNREGGN
jgi:hypothetical protein